MRVSYASYVYAFTPLFRQLFATYARPSCRIDYAATRLIAYAAGCCYAPWPHAAIRYVISLMPIMLLDATLSLRAAAISPPY